MPKRRASVKSLRVDKKKHQRNVKIKKEIKKAMKQLQMLFTNKQKAEAQALFSKMSSLLDKAAKKRVLHPNTASRKKSRLAKRLLKI